ncbi:glycosyltransferase family 4 protein [soil metagenome]
MGLTVLVNAGPWLAVPPGGYGGIENVVATLVPQLRERGHQVVLATVGDSTLVADRVISAFPTGQFAHLAGPYNQIMGIAHAHLQAVLAELRDDPAGVGTVDLVHDHVEVVGPAVLAAAGYRVPPTLQTLHWDLHKHPDFYGRFDGCGRVFFAGVSASQLARAPENLRRQAVGHVPLATPLPALPGGVPRSPGEHLLTLGRFTRVKGYDTAARICRRLGRPLIMAGPVAGWTSSQDLDAALARDRTTTMSFADVAHFVKDVRPLIDGGLVRWVGSVGGAGKDELLSSARAVLFPLRWEEPGATAVVEALSAGVPVVAMRRGVLPSLVEHGVTGFLADSEEEFASYAARVDELDRVACRKVAEERFSPAAMAEGYERLYAEVLVRASAARTSH